MVFPDLNSTNSAHKRQYQVQILHRLLSVVIDYLVFVPVVSFLLFVVFLLLLVCPIPYANPFNPLVNYFLGKVSPNIWHNSTTIFLMPFAILLFWKSYQVLSGTQKENTLLISMLVILNVFIKPSFFFVYVSVFPILLLFQFGISRSFFIKLINRKNRDKFFLY